jgi:hypothetical protein
VASADPQPAGESQKAADQGTAIHIYTLLQNAGLSDSDILDVGDELWRRIRLRVAKLAASDDVDKRLRYCEMTRRGKIYRERTNKQIVAEEILAMRFSRDELARVDAGLLLGLPGSPEKTGRRFAKVTGVDGRPQEFEVLTKKLAPGVEETFLKDTRTGHTIKVT